MTVIVPSPALPCRAFRNHGRPNALLSDAERPAHRRLARRRGRRVVEAVQERRTVRRVQLHAAVVRAGLTAGGSEVWGHVDAPAAWVDRQD